MQAEILGGDVTSLNGIPKSRTADYVGTRKYGSRDTVSLCTDKESTSNQKQYKRREKKGEKAQ